MKARCFWPTAILLCAGAVAAAEPVARPIERARAGHWVLERQLRLISSVSSLTTYEATWVDEVEGRKVHLRQQTVSADGKTGVAQSIPSVVDLDRRPAEEAKDEGKGSFTTDDTVVVGARTLRCVKTEVVTMDPVLGRLKTITWTSTEVPLFGLVKTVKSDRSDQEVERTELLAWGESGGAELPLAGKP